MSDLLRCFVALELPEPVCTAAAALARELARSFPALRALRPETIHLTLRFLGDVAQERLPAIEAGLAQTARDSEPFLFALRGAGVFPDPRRPRVLWLGATEEARLVALAERVRLATCDGAASDEKPFRAHVTIGRFRAPGATGLDAALAALAGREFGEVSARELVLFESRLLPGGAQHRPLARSPLGGAR